MAYNVLKGVVEGSVDQHADQEIGGVKVFKNTISASVFYDTDAQSPCATMKDVALITLNGTVENSILTLTADKTATANYNLTFKDGVLETGEIRAREFAGSACGLHGIRADKIVGTVAAGNVSTGPGLKDVRGALQVDVASGISIGDEGLEISLGTESGLSIVDGCLTINAEKSSQINTAGQNLSDADLLLVSDISKGKLHSTTLANLYDGYLKMKIPRPTGPAGTIQFKGNDGLKSSEKLVYDISRETLTVAGNINTTKLNVAGPIITAGAVYGNISKVTSEMHEVGEQDYTILCDSQNNPIIVMLPPACNNIGRIITVKKANADRYNIRSHPVAIKTAEGNIDLNNNMILKTNYSTRTLQSDGENWWVIGAKGN